VHLGRVAAGLQSHRHVNPEDPESARRIVADYAQVLERTFESGSWPATVDALPYPKQTLKAAIRTSLDTLRTNGNLTSDLQEFLETAYVSLADFVSVDVAQLMTEFQRASASLEADRRVTRDKVTGPAWQTIAATGTLAGNIARQIAEEAQSLKSEFQALAD
jgi:hypothetical protein